jgi:hypothetical protein
MDHNRLDQDIPEGTSPLNTTSPATVRILVLSDGTTWETTGGQAIYTVTYDAFERLSDGYISPIELIKTEIVNIEYLPL